MSLLKKKDVCIRVLILVDGMPAGGTERQIVELLKGLKRDCPHIFTLFGVLAKGGEREQEARYYADETLPIRQSHPLDVTLAWSVTRFVKELDIDIIHTFGSISDIAGVVAAKLTGVHLINGSIRSARKMLTRRDKLSKLAMRYADRIVANSQAGLEAFSMKDQWRAKVIYNGIDLQPLQNVEKFQSDAPYLCMVGNFSRKKDHGALLNALPKICEKFDRHQLFLIGKGEREQEYRQQIQESGLRGHVHIINDCIAPGGYIKGAEVCVLLSPDGEGLSNVIMEYCALGKPVVATNLGGNPEIIEHGLSGILIDSHDPHEISDAVIRLLSSKDLRERLGMRAKQIIEENFSLPQMISRYALLYESLVSEGSSGIKL